MINLIPSFRTLLVLWPGFKVISSVCSVFSTSPASRCAGQPSLSSILDKGEKKLYCPKGIDPPKCKYCLNRPEALSKDHEAETIPLQQIWRPSFILPHLSLPKLLQIFVAKTVIILDHKLITTNKGFIHIIVKLIKSKLPQTNWRKYLFPRWLL